MHPQPDGFIVYAVRQGSIKGRFVNGAAALMGDWRAWGVLEWMDVALWVNLG